MESTIKLLKVSLIALYIAFVASIIATVGLLIGGIAATAATKMSSMMLISLGAIVTGALIFIIKIFINLTKESIDEHYKIISRVNQLEREIKEVEDKQQLSALKGKREKVVEVKKPEPVKKEVVEEPVKEVDPVTRDANAIRVKLEDVILNDETITVDDKTYDIKDISKVSSIGPNLHFTVNNIKYIVEFESYSDSTRMYSYIYSRI